MRESFRDKQNRKARIAREKQESFEDRRKQERRKNERRQEDRRRERKSVEIDRRNSERRIDERRIDDRREEDKVYEDVIAGRNAVMELLKSSKDINKIYIKTI